MRKVIISGGTGFIGRWLIKDLLMNNYQVLAIIRNKNKLDNNFLTNPNFSYIEGDLRNLNTDKFPKNKFDCFFHLAWEGVNSTDKNILKMQIRNIEMSINAIELCNKLNCDKFISAGTVAEYVFSKNVLNVEEKQTPNDFYGAAKTSTHYFLNVRARQLNQKFIWAILPSTYGEFRNDNNIITYTIQSLLHRRKPSYGNLNQMWDFLYVSDVATALRLISENGKDNMIYGIGSGIYKPLKDYITIIRDLIDPLLPLGINEKPEMTQQTLSSCVNISQLCNDTGFKPLISFEIGIKKTIEYWKNKNENN